MLGTAALESAAAAAALGPWLLVSRQTLALISPLSPSLRAARWLTHSKCLECHTASCFALHTCQCLCYCLVVSLLLPCGVAFAGDTVLMVTPMFHANSWGISFSGEHRWYQACAGG